MNIKVELTTTSKDSITRKQISLLAAAHSLLVLMAACLGTESPEKENYPLVPALVHDTSKQNAFFNFETLYKKDENFWKPVLDYNKAFCVLLESTKDPERLSYIIDKLYDLAEKGDAVVQEKLYMLKRLPALSSPIAWSSDKLLQLGISQNKAWAFRERAKKIEENDREGARRDYLIAANMDDKIAAEQFSMLFPCPELPWIGQKKNKIDQKKTRELVTETEKAGNSIHLYHFYLKLKDLSYSKLATLAQNAAIKGHNTRAIIYKASELLKDKEQFEESVKFFLKAIKYGNDDASLMLTLPVLDHPETIHSKKIQRRVKEIYLKKSEEGRKNYLHFLSNLIRKNVWPIDEHCTQKTFSLLAEAILNNNVEEYYSHAVGLAVNHLVSNTDFIQFVRQIASNEAQKGNFSPVIALYEELALSETANIAEIQLAFDTLLQAVKGGNEKAFCMGMHCAAKSLITPEQQEQYFEHALEQTQNGEEAKLIRLANFAVNVKNVNNVIKERVLEQFLQQSKIIPEKFLLSKPGEHLSYVSDLCLVSADLKPEYKREIVCLLLTAAEKGDLVALKELIKFIFNNKLKIEISEEERFFNLLIEQIHELTGESLHNSNLLFSGDFEWIKENIPLAIDLLSEVANKNNPQAMMVLGHLYLGIEPSTPENLQAALFWFEKAQSLGFPLAHLYLELSERLKDNDSTMTPLEIEKEEFEVNKLIEMTFEPHIESDLIETGTDVSILNPQREKNQQHEISSPISKDGSKNKLEKTTALKPISNPKTIRAQLRLLGNIRCIEKEKTSHHGHVLDSSNQLIKDAILDGKTREIDHGSLAKLFSDPYFNNQVVLSNTKSGLMIKAHNRSTGEFKTASTHRAHTKSYKGANRGFVKALQAILEIF